ncbi:MAG: biotin/lipoyl-binding protein [Bacteroidetes bacterium]|nr:biotin/lipoyl-binding protein [Bacteroidota bacterium]
MKKDDKYSGKLKTLNIEYFKYRTLLTEKFQKRKVYQAKDPKMVLAFMPGTIRKVSVKEGEKVKAGDLLLVLDAMKMKNQILSPLEGVVKKVNAKTGNIVAKDQVLIELE